MSEFGLTFLLTHNGSFGDKSFHIISCTGTDSQAHNNQNNKLMLTQLNWPQLRKKHAKVHAKT